ncbi:hypothetical protein TgHK011_008061 [Trichoderma gracile]|nr:hypothetical protein TgHK011_008061 [Trichoderma gracile]
MSSCRRALALLPPARKSLPNATTRHPISYTRILDGERKTALGYMRDSADGFGPRSILNHSLIATVKAKSEDSLCGHIQNRGPDSTRRKTGDFAWLMVASTALSAGHGMEGKRDCPQYHLSACIDAMQVRQSCCHIETKQLIETKATRATNMPRFPASSALILSFLSSSPSSLSFCLANDAASGRVTRVTLSRFPRFAAVLPPPVGLERGGLWVQASNCTEQNASASYDRGLGDVGYEGRASRVVS